MKIISYPNIYNSSNGNHIMATLILEMLKHDIEICIPCHHIFVEIVTKLQIHLNKKKDRRKNYKEKLQKKE